MHHFFEAITNTDGQSLIGYFARVANPSNQSIVPIYSDNAGTPVSVISGVTNAAKTDDYGNLSLYVEPGTYNLDIYANDATTFLFRVPNVAMNSTKGDKGVPGDIGATGPADNTYTSYAALLASSPSRKSARLAANPPDPAQPNGNFTYENGAWVRQSVAGITRKRPGATTLLRTADNVENEKHPNAFDYIPAANHNAIMARTSTYDATADLQKLANENQRWVLPRGLFYLSGDGISVPAGGYGSGAGSGRTTLKKTTDQAAQLIRVNGATGVTLEDFDMDGSRSQTSTYDIYKFCLYATSADNLTLRRLGAKGATTDNVTIELCKNAVIDSLVTTDCNKQGLYLSSCDGIQITGLRGFRNGAQGVGSTLAIACTWGVSIVGMYSANNVQSEIIVGRGSKKITIDSTSVLGDTINGRSGAAAIVGVAEAISGVVHGQTYDGRFYGTDELRLLGAVVNGRLILELVNDLTIDGGLISGETSVGSAINLLGCIGARISTEVRDWNLVGVARFNSDKNGGVACDSIQVDRSRFRNAGSSTRAFAYNTDTNFVERESTFNGVLVEGTTTRANKGSANVGAFAQAAGATPTGTEFNAVVDKLNLLTSRLQSGATA